MNTNSPAKTIGLNDAAAQAIGIDHLPLRVAPCGCSYRGKFISSQGCAEDHSHVQCSYNRRHAVPAGESAATTVDLTRLARELSRKHTKPQLVRMCEAAGTLGPLARWSKQDLAVEAARAELVSA